MQVWTCLVLVIYVRIQCALASSVVHHHLKKGHDDHSHLGSHYGSHSHDLHGDHHDGGGKSYGGLGGFNSGGHKYGGARGALDSFFSEQHNRGLVARDRGFGYEKAYAYDKQVALKDIGAKKSGYKGLQHAKGRVSHKIVDVGYKGEGDGRLGTAGSSKKSEVDSSYSSHDFEKDFSDDFYSPRFLPGSHRPSYSYYN